MLPPAYTARETTDVRGLDACSEQITFYTDMEPLLPNGQPNPDFGKRQFREEILCDLTLTLTLTLSLTLTLIRRYSAARIPAHGTGPSPRSGRSPRYAPAISPRSPRRGRTPPPWPYPYPHPYP